MKKITVVHHAEHQPTPVTFWVHHHLGGDPWHGATSYDPPLPRPVPGKGWAQVIVELDGLELRFSSPEELAHVIEILAENPLPTTRRLSELRGSAKGPNSHWLSRLPAKAKSLAFRRRLVGYLRTIDPAVWP